jgi:hypothetical protein
VGYREQANDNSEMFYHWSFKERSLNNIAPKVKVASTLMLNPGVAKALDIGKSVMHTIRPLTPRRKAKQAHKHASKQTSKQPRPQVTKKSQQKT